MIITMLMTMINDFMMMMMIEVRSLKDILVVVVGCGVLGICAARAHKTESTWLGIGSAWLGSARLGSGACSHRGGSSQNGWGARALHSPGTLYPAMDIIDAEPAQQQTRASGPARLDSTTRRNLQTFRISSPWGQRGLKKKRKRVL
jgi:hypothetical protein